MGVTVGLLDFYILEASEYVDQLDALVGRGRACAAGVDAVHHGGARASRQLDDGEAAPHGGAGRLGGARWSRAAGRVRPLEHGGALRRRRRDRRHPDSASDRSELERSRGTARRDTHRRAAPFVPEGAPRRPNTPISGAVSPTFFASEVEGGRRGARRLSSPLRPIDARSTRRWGACERCAASPH